MIFKVENYTVTLAYPDTSEAERVVYGRPLVARVCRNRRDMEEVIRQLRLVAQGRVTVAVAIFEPAQKGSHDRRESNVRSHNQGRA